MSQVDAKQKYHDEAQPEETEERVVLSFSVRAKMNGR